MLVRPSPFSHVLISEAVKHLLSADVSMFAIHLLGLIVQRGIFSPEPATTNKSTCDPLSSTEYSSLLTLSSTSLDLLEVSESTLRGGVIWIEAMLDAHFALQSVQLQSPRKASVAVFICCERTKLKVVFPSADTSVSR